jgi:hypothetical protein
MKKENKIWQVITASSLGTLIEWYDFYIFGSLATVIAGQFFSTYPWHEIATKPGINTVIQWGVFGFYAIKGEYNH